MSNYCFFLCILFSLIGAGIYILIRYGNGLSVRLKRFLYPKLSTKPTQSDLLTTNSYLDSPKESEQRINTLNEYFIRGFLKYQTKDFARAYYPGWLSIRELPVNGLEGFARTIPLIASYILNKASVSIEDLAIIDNIAKGLLVGTDPHSKEYYGDIVNGDQRIVECVDIVRFLWISKDYVWKRYSEDQKKQISSYLLQVNNRDIPQNNWLLFSHVINLGLKTLGVVVSDTDFRYSETNYEKFKSDYLDDGWFYDYPNGVDYYNCWGIGYDLLWIHIFDNSYDSEFVVSAIKKSSNLTKYLISPIGIPIMGRSSCYRLAIPIPLLAECFLDESLHVYQIAKRSVFSVLDHFIEKNVLRDGTLTLGYWNNDIRLIDEYTGPGSQHWSLRTLTLVNLLRNKNLFFSVQSLPLPIEQYSYHLVKPKLGWEIVGDHKTQEIQIIINKNIETQSRLYQSSFNQRFKEILKKTVIRPNNIQAKYKLRKYSNTRHFFELSD